jgi:hypothetical protein
MIRRVDVFGDDHTSIQATSRKQGKNIGNIHEAYNYVWFRIADGVTERANDSKIPDPSMKQVPCHAISHS